MGYRYKRTKKPSLGYRSNEDLNKIAINKLQKEIELLKQELNEEIEKYHQWQVNKPKYLEYQNKYDKYYATEIAPIMDQINILKNDRENYKSILGIFQRSELLDSVSSQVNHLQDLIRQKEINMKYKIKVVDYCPDTYNTYKISTLQSQVIRYQTFLDRKLKKTENLDHIKALAATATKTSRELSRQVKKKIKNQNCPYCGVTLFSDYHTDHIYPDSKGGHATVKNLVNVCSSCNLKKGAMTLTAFIKKYDLDRDYIEQNFEALGKDF